MRSFNEMNPISIISYYIAVTFITMFSMDPVILSISLSSAILTCCLYSKPGAGAHIFSAVLFIIAAVINPLTVHNGATVLFYLNSRPITMEAAVYGLCAAAMITAALYRLRSLSKDIDGEKLMYIFGRFSPKLSLLLSMALRNVELFRSRWRRIQDAQRALGKYGDGNLIDAVRGRLRVLSILITWSLENGVVTAQSMDARGYGSRRRSSFRIFRFSLSDLLFILLTAGLTGLTIAGLYGSPISFYPTIEADLFTPAGIAGYTAYAVLSILPIIINTKEAIRWRFLRSRI